MKTHHRARHLPRPVHRTGRARSTDRWSRPGRWAGARSGYDGRADPRPTGAATASTSSRRRRSRRLLRRGRRATPRRARPGRSPSCRPICRASCVAVHPAYDELFDGFAPAAGARQSGGAPGVGGGAADAGRQGQPRASACTAHATFSGALAWPYLYPWPQRPAGLVEEGFAELARRWRPILDAFDDAGVDVCYEIHPGEDLHDGATFERFLDAVGRPPARQHPLRSQPLRAAAARLPGLHRPLPRAHQGLPRQGRRVPPERPRGRLWRLSRAGSTAPGRFRSLGDGQVDFGAIFSQAGASTTTPAGRCSNGSAALKHPRGRRARRRAVHPRPHHPRDRAAPSTTSPRPARDRGGRIAGCWAWTR